jgi:transcriptional regulator with XRE-family HTH domain
MPKSDEEREAQKTYSLAIGYVVKTRRKKAGLTAAQAAKKTGCPSISEGAMSRIECGRCVPTAWQMRAVAQMAGVPLPELVAEVEQFFKYAQDMNDKVGALLGNLKDIPDGFKVEMASKVAKHLTPSRKRRRKK